MSKKRIYLLITVLFIIAGIIGSNYYQKIFGKSINKDGAIYVRSTASISDLAILLKPYVNTSDDFSWLAAKKKFTQPKGGMYLLKKDMSMNDVVNLLRIGQQTPVKITFNNQHTLEDLAGRIATQIEADSISIINAIKDPQFLTSQSLTEKSVLGMYIPNSYELYWNTSAEQFRDRMLKEYHRFWNEKREQAAKKLNLNRTQVIALASIVQKETAKISERPIVAGLYLNRIKSKMPLQADPTIIFALKEKYGQDFVVKRVLNRDLKIDSPYNTYFNRGIPPTLIAMPDISSIDAVLFAEKHNYLYMCVNVDNIGYHAFASSLKQHNRNASKYHRWLDIQGINR
ncbi:MAG: endolytic transglycosylase MltG [Flavobacteriaceae bacterium]|nr:endolytic transglycosylase MltG [Flavobacteriaceae bacterium]